MLSKNKSFFLFLTSTIAYVLVLKFTPFSFTGFFTDFVVLIGLLVYLHLLTFAIHGQTVLVKAGKLIARIIIGFSFLFLLALIIMPFGLNFLKSKLIDYKVKGHFIEIEYHRPVGAWGCGNGVYWQTKTLKYFPIIEYNTKYESCTHRFISEDD